jgi:NAD(P)-dependent dehydrogenase (short-subunit alcohol dehydrogenase family)
MSSIVAVHPCKNDAPYCATKGAINAMATSLALEYEKHGVVVVPMCPSYVESEMTDRSIAGLANRKKISLEEAREKIAQSCPGGRILPAEELAEAIATICTNQDPALSGKPYLLQ